MLTQFAVNESGCLVCIAEVERGLACSCTCEVCGQVVVAKKGEEREHHFAHAANTVACEVSYESQLHRYAKELIEKHRGLYVPALTQAVNLTPRESDGFWLAFDRVELETCLGDIRPDIIGYLGDEPFLIEVAYSSFVSQEKLEKIKETRLSALEIDLRQFEPHAFEPSLVKRMVVDEAAGKTWLHTVQSTVIEEPAPQTMVPILPPIREEIVTVRGNWISVRHLPWGDVALRVIAFNRDLNEMVKGVARRYYGRWNPQYKNWVVPARCGEMAINELKRIASANP
jgi:competence protein CoiA